MAELIEPVTQFGVAGLMGALWVWERLASRRREEQLGEAHERLMAERQALQAVVELVRRNTRAIERFDQTQARLSDLLERVSEVVKRHAA